MGTQNVVVSAILLIAHVLSSHTGVAATDSNQCIDNDVGVSPTPPSSPPSSIISSSSSIPNNDENKNDNIEFDKNNNEDIHDDYDLTPLWPRYPCDDIFAHPRPIHNQSTWLLLRGAYQGTVGRAASTIHTPVSHSNGFRVPFDARMAPGKGRGVFATSEITHGQLVWTSRVQSARFWDGKDYLWFLDALPADVACDVIQWAYVQDLGGGGEDDYNPAICVDLDEGSYVNSGGWVEGEDENVGCIEELAVGFPGGCRDNFFALRDISAGEEILCSYGDFAISNGWSYFGLYY